MIIVNTHRVSNAIRFKTTELNNMWLLVGGQDAWPDEGAPPTPSTSASLVNTIIGAVSCTLSLVVQDPAGTLTVLGPLGEETWRELTSDLEGYTESCRWVLVKATLSGSAFPTTPFRELGFTLGLIPTAGNESKSLLIASEISSIGKLQTLEYRTVVNRDINNSYTLYNIMEF